MSLLLACWLTWPRGVGANVLWVGLWVDDRKTREKLRVHYNNRLPEAEEEWLYNLTEHGDRVTDLTLQSIPC